MSLTGNTSTITLDDGTKAFRKALVNAPAEFFDYEAAGLRTLGKLGARVPKVYEVTNQQLIIEQIQAKPQRRIKNPEYTFGQELAQLHLTGQAVAETNQTSGTLQGLSHADLGGAERVLQPTTILYESFVPTRSVAVTRRAAECGQVDHRPMEFGDQVTLAHLGPAEAPAVVHGGFCARKRIVDDAGA